MKARFLVVAGIFFLAVALRLYHVTSPIADWHSFRQTDTASVARLYVQHGLDLLHPRYQDLSNIQSGKDNPKGYRMVEFPLYQALAVYGYRVVSSVSVEVWLRIVSIAASAGSAVLLTLFVGQLVDPFVGVISGLLYAVLPYSIYYGRVTLPDPLAVFLAMLSLYVLYRKNAIVLSAFFGALALLVKPTAAFLLVPVPYIIVKKNGYSLNFLIRSFVYAFICLLPLMLWRQWILRFPEGIPASEWLLNKDNIRFKGAWFYWLFSQRLGSLMLGWWGLLPFGLGLVLPVGKKEGWASRWLLFGSLLYFIVFAGGNVQHDYYQIVILPVVCLFTGKGLAWMLQSRTLTRVMAVFVASVSIVFALAFSWYTVRTYYWINRPEIIEAGRSADRLLRKDAKVIAPYNGDTTFLYQTGRVGWPEGFDIDKKISEGATSYVTVSPTDNDWETKELAQKYTVLMRNDKFAIIDLTKPKKATSKQ